MIQFVAMLKSIIEKSRKEQISLEEIRRNLSPVFTDTQINNFLTDLENNGDITASSSNGQKYFEFTG